MDTWRGEEVAENKSLNRGRDGRLTVLSAEVLFEREMNVLSEWGRREYGWEGDEGWVIGELGSDGWLALKWLGSEGKVLEGFFLALLDCRYCVSFQSVLVLSWVTSGFGWCHAR